MVLQKAFFCINKVSHLTSPPWIRFLADSGFRDINSVILKVEKMKFYLPETLGRFYLASLAFQEVIYRTLT